MRILELCMADFVIVATSKRASESFFSETRIKNQFIQNGVSHTYLRMRVLERRGGRKYILASYI